MSADNTLAAMAAAACARVAAFSVRRAVFVVLAYALLAAGSLWIAATQLAVDTNPDQMISTSLPFRKQYYDFLKAFPAMEGTFVVVIDAVNGTEGRQVAHDLAKAFAARPDLYDDVNAPGTGQFFDDYGLLYLPPDQIGKIVANIRDASPMLKMLARRPNIAGMARLVGGINQAASAGAAPPGTERVLKAIDASLAGEINGQRKVLDWSALAGGPGGDLPKRWYVMASPVLDFSVLDASAGPYNEAARLVADPRFSHGGEVKLRLTGEAAMNAEEFHAVVSGATMAGLASLVLVSIIVFFGLPLLRLNVAALALLIFGFLINAGFATLVIGHLNMISVAFAVLFIGLGVDYAVHIILRFCEEVRAGVELLPAVVKAASSAGPALALCTATTALAFLSFAPTAFSGMGQLGVIAGAGTVIAFFASLTLVPAILALMPSVVPALRARPARTWRWTRRITGALRLPLSLSIIVLALVSALLLPAVRFDGDPVDLKDPTSASVITFKKLVAENPGLAYPGEVLVKPGAAADKLAAALKALPEVAVIDSLKTYIPGDQPAKLALLEPLHKAVPAELAPLGALDAKELSAALDQLKSNAADLAQSTDASAELRSAAADLVTRIDSFRKVHDSNPEALSKLDNAWFAAFPATVHQLQTMAALQPVTEQTIDADLRSRFITADGRERLEIVPRGDMRNQAELYKFVDAVTAVAPNAVGPPMEIAGAARAVSAAMRWAVLAALALVVLVVAPVLRRPLDIALVLAPLVIAAALLCGYTVVFHAPFNFANVIVLPLLLGLGIDSSIHYVMRAREHHEDHIVDTSTPRAVLVSALTTIGSFGTLWLSPHLGMASMGELLTIAIIVTLITTLIVLPQLIAWADRLFPPPGA